MLRGMRVLSSIALVVAAAAGCAPASAPGAAAPPLSPATPMAASVTSCLVPGCDATAFIVAAIDGARREIRGQAYNFTSAPIVAALVRAKARGIDVAMLLDKISPCQRGAGADALAAAGIPVMIDARPRIAHNKVLIIDAGTSAARLILGSFNFSAAAMRNAEDTNLVSSPAVAAQYRAYWTARQALSTPFGARERWCRPRRLSSPS
jgi:phosphatidylserine/phosphatidylglycerophosphate/cardiolipin synthase-like enzyme